MAGAGCNCITINIGSPPYAAQGAAQGAAQARQQVERPAGGNFVPVQALEVSSGSLTVCNPPQPVSGTYVRFYPPTQIPNTGDTGFRGYLWNVTANAAIANTDYYLQWIVTGANTGCCTPVGGSSTDVSCLVTPGLTYRFTAHFKTGHVPPGNPTIQLNGAWTQ